MCRRQGSFCTGCSKADGIGNCAGAICGRTVRRKAEAHGAAVEAITNLALKSAVIYLLIYLALEILMDSFISNIASSMLQKIESKLTRKLGYFTYKKALNMPSYAYEEKTSGEVINRITNDAIR